MDLGIRRTEKLGESYKAYQLVREAGELAQWINDKEQVALTDEVGDDLEQVEVIQRKFDDFQKDLKANEARLVELNTIAERLTAMGQTEAAEKIRIQIEDLNQRWAALQQVSRNLILTGNKYFNFLQKSLYTGKNFCFRIWRNVSLILLICFKLTHLFSLSPNGRNNESVFSGHSRKSSDSWQCSRSTTLPQRC